MLIIQEHFVYIVTNKRLTLFYVGLASNLVKRIHEHKIGKVKFTKKYNLDQLVYFESYSSKSEAAKREKQLKNWSKEKKLKLIKKMNPELVDLSQNWFWKRDPSTSLGINSLEKPLCPNTSSLPNQ